MPATPELIAPNALLGGLTEPSLARLEWLLLVPFEIVFEPEVPPAHVYFPAGCVAAMLLPDDSGGLVQVAMVGAEGMLGVDAFLGGATRLASATTMIQFGGPAWRLDATQFAFEVSTNFALQQRLMRYALSLVSQIARITTCVREHTPTAQLARWLLQFADRRSASGLALAPEQLGPLLGLSPSTLAESLLALQDAGGIALADDGLRLGARDALEQASCDCYPALRASELGALLLESVPHALFASLGPQSESYER